MASVFWDTHEILFIDYLEKGKTINSERYIGQLMRLKNEIGEKRLQMKKKKVLFHQDNAPYHKSLATMAKLNELSFELHKTRHVDASSKYTGVSNLSCCLLKRS